MVSQVLPGDCHSSVGQEAARKRDTIVQDFEPLGTRGPAAIDVGEYL